MTAHETKTFKSGNSIALRLPKSMGVGPDERMLIEQDGDMFTVRRAVDPAEAKRKLLEMLDELAALPKPDYIEKHEPFEFPDRPGL
jgi:antitoxin VapB